MNSLLKRLSKMRNLNFFLIDAVIFSVTPVLALGIRLDGFSSVTSYFPDLQNATLLFLAIKLSLLYWFGLYRCCWRYASVDELMQIARFTTAATVLQSLLFAKVYYLISLSSFHALPRSLPLLDGLLSFIFIGGVRFSLRTLERLRQQPSRLGRGDRTLAVGAGCPGVSLVQEMQRNPSLGFNPVAFVDNASEKLNLSIRGVLVAGNRYKIPELVRSFKIHRLVTAMTTAPDSVIREIENLLRRQSIQPTHQVPQSLTSERF